MIRRFCMLLPASAGRFPALALVSADNAPAFSPATFDASFFIALAALIALLCVLFTRRKN